MNRGIIGVLLGVMLTARMGVLHNAETGFTETWYNLPMRKVQQKAVENGYSNDFWNRADGMKMISHYIICAGAPGRYGEVMQTSRGQGLILDTHETDADVIDLAVTW